MVPKEAIQRLERLRQKVVELKQKLVALVEAPIVQYQLVQ
jgi:hypothetical protein